MKEIHGRRKGVGPTEPQSETPSSTPEPAKETPPDLPPVAPAPNPEPAKEDPPAEKKPLRISPNYEEQVRLPGLDGLKVLLSHAPSPKAIFEGTISGVLVALLILWFSPQATSGQTNMVIQTPFSCIPSTAPTISALIQ